jgi:RNA polymerase sigma factor (sigma-70 family)
MNDLLQEFSDVQLTAIEEAALVARIKDGDEEALVELVMANMRRALLYTQRVDRGKIDLPSLVSVCYQELCMSAKRFDPRRGRFFAFSKAGLRGRLFRHWNSFRVVRNQTEQTSLDAMASPRGGSSIHAMGATAVKEHQLSDDNSGNGQFSTRESITGEVEEFEIDLIAARDQLAYIRKKFSSTISEHHWMIIELAYQGRLNFRQIGALLGVSRARISRCHAEAMTKLRNAVKREKLLGGV